MPSARAAVQTLHPYQPPIGNRSGLRLDFNENTLGCSPHVIRKLREVTSAQLACYPEREPVERIVARFLEVAPSEALLTNGVDEAIHLVCATYLGPGDEALIPVPTFALYEIYARATGAKAITIPAEKDFVFPAKAMLAAVTPQTKVIIVASPNNPTGAVAEISDLLQLAQAAPQAVVLVDEAYFEFFGKSILPEIGNAPNLLVARTFSKAYGLAGLRAGVLAGDSKIIEMVRRVASPYNVNAVALACLPEALADQEYVRVYVEQVRHGRAKLQQELHAMRITSWPSEANFVLAKIGALRTAFVQEMRQRGILVRDRNHDPGCEGCVRITLGIEAQNQQLLQALASAVENLRNRTAQRITEKWDEKSANS